MTAHWGTWLICGARERSFICIIIWSVEEDGELEEEEAIYVIPMRNKNAILVKM